MAVELAIQRILGKVGVRVPATKLVKLVYLADYVYYQHYGETITGLEYQWDHFGPNAVQHGIISAAESLAIKEKITYRTQRNQHGSVTKYFGTTPDFETPILSAEAEMVISDVVNKYGRLSVKKITEVSKKTQPFRSAAQYDMLTMERIAPALHTTVGDVEAYQHDLAENGTYTLKQIIGHHVGE